MTFSLSNHASSRKKSAMTQDLNSNYQGVFDHSVGYGSRPALLIVDFIRAYTTQDSSLYAQAVVEAVQATGALLDAAHACRIPVIFTRVIYHPSGRDGGIFVQKVPVLRTLVEGAPMAEIVPELPPGEHDIIINKQYASAFFGTSLAAMLTSSRVDTVILAGCSTSGCVRASAVDAMQYGFRVVVPRECVGDRHPAPHEANLFDINSKYGDVVSRASVLQYLNHLAAQQTDNAKEA
jgi:maleamate amidohydrolase